MVTMLLLSEAHVRPDVGMFSPLESTARILVGTCPAQSWCHLRLSTMVARAGRWHDFDADANRHARQAPNPCCSVALAALCGRSQLHYSVVTCRHCCRTATGPWYDVARCVTQLHLKRT